MTSESEFQIRRIVTGVGSDGRSFIESDGPSPHVTLLNDSGSFVCADIWRTAASPSQARAPDRLNVPTILAPEPGGSVVRVMRFPPERELAGKGGETTFHAGDESGAEAIAGQDMTIHPMMHKTKSVDYAIVLSGEIVAIMEDGETTMRAGDVLVQRATSHSWANRSDVPCMIAFVLVDARDE
jgi:quercetin dioxygenase-like cupin family protein